MTSQVNYKLVLTLLELFKNKVKCIDLELIDFHDEDATNEKFINILSFFRVWEIYMTGSVIRLRTSAIFFLARASRITCENSMIKFPKMDITCLVKHLSMKSSKLLTYRGIVSNQLLFENVEKCYIEDVQCLDNIIELFSDKLEQLYIHKNFNYNYIKKNDILE